jgi:hypothetical protein
MRFVPNTVARVKEFHAEAERLYDDFMEMRHSPGLSRCEGMMQGSKMAVDLLSQPVSSPAFRPLNDICYLTGWVEALNCAIEALEEEGDE